MNVKILAVLTSLFIVHSAHASKHLSHELERINFFPEVKRYLSFEYEYEQFTISTPRRAVQTKEVRNFSNMLVLSYAQKLSRKMFLGARLFFEQASENAVSYGVPLSSRFTSVGLKEPEISMRYRLRHQSDEQGLIDLYLGYSPKFGQRELGQENSNRLNGRDILRVGFSHGLWEEEWEFKSALLVEYYGEGEERNAFESTTSDLSTYYNVNFQFTTQYRVNPWLFIFGSAGIIYYATETVHQRTGERREILPGTGSRFELGMKKPLGEKTLLELSYLLNRNEYFVKGDGENLEGNAIRQILGMNFRYAF